MTETSLCENPIRRDLEMEENLKVFSTNKIAFLKMMGCNEDEVGYIDGKVYFVFPATLYVQGCFDEYMNPTTYKSKQIKGFIREYKNTRNIMSNYIRTLPRQAEN